MPNSKFVNKINFLQEPGASATVMPSDDMLMYLEMRIRAPAEEECEYGIYSKAREIPIFFVRTFSHQILAHFSLLMYIPCIALCTKHRMYSIKVLNK